MTEIKTVQGEILARTYWTRLANLFVIKMDDKYYYVVAAVVGRLVFDLTVFTVGKKKAKKLIKRIRRCALEETV